MKKINLKEILIPIIVLTVICLISGAALSITNEATAFYSNQVFNL